MTNCFLVLGALRSSQGFLWPTWFLLLSLPAPPLYPTLIFSPLPFLPPLPPSPSHFLHHLLPSARGVSTVACSGKNFAWNLRQHLTEAGVSPQQLGDPQARGKLGPSQTQPSAEHLHGLQTEGRQGGLWGIKRFELVCSAATWPLSLQEAGDVDSRES